MNIQYRLRREQSRVVNKILSSSGPVPVKEEVNPQIKTVSDPQENPLISHLQQINEAQALEITSLKQELNSLRLDLLEKEKGVNMEKIKEQVVLTSAPKANQERIAALEEQLATLETQFLNVNQTLAEKHKSRLNALQAEIKQVSELQ